MVRYRPTHIILTPTLHMQRFIFHRHHCSGQLIRRSSMTAIRARGETPVLLTLAFFLLVTAWAQLLSVEPPPLTALGALVGGGGADEDNYFGHDR